MIGQPSELSSLLKFLCKSFGTNLGWSLQALLQIEVTHSFGKLIWIGCQQSLHDKESVYIWHLSWMIANALNLWIVYFSLMISFCVIKQWYSEIFIWISSQNLHVITKYNLERPGHGHFFHLKEVNIGLKNFFYIRT